MLQDMIHSPEQLPIVNEELSSPIVSQMFDFSDFGLYPKALQSSEVSSSSSGCYDDNSFVPNLTLSSSFASFPHDTIKFNTNSSSSNSNSNNNNNNNNNDLSILFDLQQDTETDLSTSLNNILSPPCTENAFSLPSYFSNQHDQVDLLWLQSQTPLSDTVSANGFSPCSPDAFVQLAHQLSLSSVLEEDYLCPLPHYVCFDPYLQLDGSFLDQTGMGYDGYAAGNLNGEMSVDASGMFLGSIVMESQEWDFQGENGGVYSSDSVYSSGELQEWKGLNENQQEQLVVTGYVSMAPLKSDISTLEESTFKVGRLSVEERKEKIHRYMKKRNERNFTKKIKYACRKTLADSRPRVRGRFAKNDEFGEVTRPSCNNHEDEDEEEVGVKEEEEMVDSADIFAHISELNSFKCSYPTQSWI